MCELISILNFYDIFFDVIEQGGGRGLILYMSLKEKVNKIIYFFQSFEKYCVVEIL